MDQELVQTCFRTVLALPKLYTQNVTGINDTLNITENVTMNISVPANTSKFQLDSKLYY